MERVPRKVQARSATLPRLRRVPQSLGTALVALALALGAAGIHAQQTKSRKKKPAPPPAAAAVPFRPGERLEYAVQWNKFVTAALLKLTVVEQRDFFGQPAWHFQAMAQTIDPVHMIYTLDDQFDSYTDAVTLESRQYEAYIREQGKRDDLVVPMATKPELERTGVQVYLVLPGTQDPLGFFYELRAHDWGKEPSMRVPVFDGHRFYEIQAQRESAGMPVAVAAGNFVVTRIALKILQGGQEVPNLKVWVSLTGDASRTPVLIEAEAPFGTVRAEMTASGGTFGD
jgi:Protein of unknown function (DUF3108)